MLIEFRVSNFRSLKDEQVVTLEADSAEGGEDPRLRIVDCHHRALLPAAVIFGSNASGKSNMLAALAFMQQAVLHSAEAWFTADGFPRNAFAWSSKSKDPSLFEAVFVSQGVKYQYGFVVDDYSVLEEWLYGWSGGESVPIFVRERSRLECEIAAVRQIVTQDWPLHPGRLCLSSIRDLTVAELQSATDWFDRLFAVNINLRLPAVQPDTEANKTANRPERMELPEEGTRLWQLCKEFLRSADLGIVDVKQVRSPNGQSSIHPDCRSDQLSIRHTEEDDSWLDLEQESEGTKNLVRMAVPIVRAIECGGLVLIDELESSLHPLLGHAIIDLFHRPQSNPRGAQVLFTTHDTRLLGSGWDRPLLRRDQIWLAAKDRTGASTIYPLTDYHRLESENIERGYLQGRYGGIPFCKSFSWEEE